MRITAYIAAMNVLVGCVSPAPGDENKSRRGAAVDVEYPDGVSLADPEALEAICNEVATGTVPMLGHACRAADFTVVEQTVSRLYFDAEGSPLTMAFEVTSEFAETSWQVSLQRTIESDFRLGWSASVASEEAESGCGQEGQACCISETSDRGCGTGFACRDGTCNRVSCSALTTCGSCVDPFNQSASGDECGWCRDTGACMVGTHSGPTSGTCSYAGWTTILRDPWCLEDPSP